LLDWEQRRLESHSRKQEILKSRLLAFLTGRESRTSPIFLIKRKRKESSFTFLPDSQEGKLGSHTRNEEEGEERIVKQSYDRTVFKSNCQKWSKDSATAHGHRSPDKTFRIRFVRESRQNLEIVATEKSLR
jgi:hypothetical protein